MFVLEDQIRKNINALKPYASARDEYSGEADVFLDANENPFPNGMNRYPDPHQRSLRRVIADLKGTKPEQIFTGNGSDEVIDLLIRVFCNPGKDNMIILPPTYGMYAVSAAVNEVEVREAQLTPSFQPDVEATLATSDENSRLLFICSPNNPSGNLMDRSAVIRLIEGFGGIVVVDEAYIDFCPGASTINLLADYPNLFIIQTLSKAWGMAGVRLGIGIGDPKLIRILDNIKPPYNISLLNANVAIKRLNNPGKMHDQVQLLLNERGYLECELRKLKLTRVVYHSDTNFLLVKMNKANEIFRFLTGQKIVVRNRSNAILCENCLRITVGTPDENRKLISALRPIDNIDE
ncbi:MAG: histidinol-phosphate transaminase [Bacteroidales bacterium]|nr:histidinol-phosphate transaminase [Bacteroidales bacterium]